MKYLSRPLFIFIIFIIITLFHSQVLCNSFSFSNYIPMFTIQRDDNNTIFYIHYRFLHGNIITDKYNQRTFFGTEYWYLWNRQYHSLHQFRHCWWTGAEYLLLLLQLLWQLFPLEEPPWVHDMHQQCTNLQFFHWTSSPGAYRTCAPGSGLASPCTSPNFICMQEPY